MSSNTQEQAQEVLKIENLSISYQSKYGEVPAVVDFNLTVNAGDKVGIVGESGCGKSTVAYAIMRYLGNSGKVTDGHIYFEGNNIPDMTWEEIRQIRGKKIAMIYQEPMSALNPTMKIGRQLMEVPQYHETGISKTEAKNRCMEILEDVQMPDPKRVFNAYPHELSGGQQQRIVIALALLSNPSLLILDEPTTALDVTVEKGILELVSIICEKYKTSLIFISHNLGLIMNVCNKITVMYSGQTVERGETADVFEKKRHPYTAGLFCCIPTAKANKYTNPLIPIDGQLPLAWERPPGCYFGPRCQFFKAGICDSEMPKLVAVGENADHVVRCARLNEIKDQVNDTPVIGSKRTEPGEVIIKAENLKKYYTVSAGLFGGWFQKKRHVKANDNIDLYTQKGEILAIVGESGCGKSTLANVMLGLERGTGGSLKIFNREVSHIPINKRGIDFISAVQMIFQNPNDTLNPKITIGRQIGRTIKKFKTKVGRDEINKYISYLLESVRIPAEYADYKPSGLSGGQKQRVAIARTFAANPSLIIADEPLSALDVSVQAAITELLLDMREAYDNTLIIISHDLSLVRYLADRTAVMYLGKIMEHGKVDEVYQPPFHPYTESLISAAPFVDSKDKAHQKNIVLKGEIPSAMNPPKGCPFSTRCPRYLGEICDNQEPPLQKLSATHSLCCHIPADQLVN